MSRFGRIRRRPDDWASPHERARARAAERLDGPIGLAEATWLDEHLGACASCAVIAAAYETDRAALRLLRDAVPEPPRDLWARTAAALEQESAARGRRASQQAVRRGLPLPVGVLSGIAVIAVVVGVSAVSSGLFNGTGGTTALTGVVTPSPNVAVVAPPGTASPELGSPAPTPFAVGAGDVQWVRTGADGVLAYNAASIREVCPVRDAEDCAVLDDGSGERLALTATPKSIVGSPTDRRAVVFSDGGGGGAQVVVLTLPAASTEPGATATPEPSGTPAATPPPGTEQPTPSDAAPTGTPPATPDVSGAPSPTVAAPSPSTEPAPTPTVEPSPSVGPSISPEPTVAATLAIASDVAIVGENAAFSADGTWFAFTARPIDGSAGPDIYVWRVGDERARPLTSDGHSYFASWAGTDVVASRPAVTAAEGTATPTADASASPATTGSPTGASGVTSVLIDPLSGAERPAGDLWRPAVDPTRQRAVAWAGTITVGEDGATVTPARGRLELRAWSEADAAAAADGKVQVVTDGPIGDFDVHWDETGTWFATWIVDPSGSEVGRLSLYHLDPATGRLDRPDGAPKDVAALAGFSIGDGRLAWATPPGQGGEGSRVQIVAWTSDGVGILETAPGEGVLVIR